MSASHAPVLQHEPIAADAFPRVHRVVILGGSFGNVAENAVSASLMLVASDGLAVHRGPCP